jgi:hypothetical protein
MLMAYCEEGRWVAWEGPAAFCVPTTLWPAPLEVTARSALGHCDCCERVGNFWSMVGLIQRELVPTPLGKTPFVARWGTINICYL